MAHAIIRGANGRRHEVDFDDDAVLVTCFVGEAAVDIEVEESGEMAPSEKKRFAIINIPRRLFDRAMAEAARRAKK